MSCLYPPLVIFSFFYLHIFFLPPSIWRLCVLSVGVWVTCFLPSASSRTASPVCSAPVLHSLYDAFLALLVCWLGNVFVCLLTTISPPSACLSASLCLACPFPFLWSVLLHSYHAFPTAIQSWSSRVSSFSDYASFVLCLCAIESSPVTAFLLAIQLEFSVVWNVPPVMFLFRISVC